MMMEPFDKKRDLFNSLQPRTIGMKGEHKMKGLNPTRLLLTLVCLLTLLNGTSLAALQAVGPNDPVTTMPTWYMDTSGLPLAPCVDQNNLCILPGAGPNNSPPNFDPALGAYASITTTGPIDETNFPEEAFYYSAFAVPFDIEDPTQLIDGVAQGDSVSFGSVLEFAFLGGVAPEGASIFLRTDLQKMSLGTSHANTWYRVTHPYGVFEFETDGAGDTLNNGGAIRYEDLPGTFANYMPPLFKAAPNTNIGPFLIPAGGSASFITDPLDPDKVYIGDPAVPVFVTGSPTGNNFVRIERLDGQGGTPVAGKSWETNSFLLMGRVFTDQIPSPMAIDRITYASDGANGQLDVFVTALPGAAPEISGTNLTPTLLTLDDPITGKFFAHIPFVGLLPTDVIVTNLLDDRAIPYPVTPVDEVAISQAIYHPTTQLLTIKAASRDTFTPPTLTAPAFAGAFDAGTLVVDLSLTIPPSTTPPLNVQVVSSQGGSATVKVSVDDGSAVTSGVTR